MSGVGGGLTELKGISMKLHQLVLQTSCLVEEMERVLHVLV